MDDTLIRMLQLGQKGYNCSQIIILLGEGHERPGLWVWIRPGELRRVDRRMLSPGSLRREGR